MQVEFKMKYTVLKSLCIMLGSVALLLLCSLGFEWGIANYSIDFKPLQFVSLNEVFIPNQMEISNAFSPKDSLPKEFDNKLDSNWVNKDPFSIEFNPETPLFVEGEILPEDTIHNELHLYNPKRGENHALDAFFQELERLEVLNPKDLNIRIAHYGDSQLEGGLITHDIRELFKKSFKGGGTGFIPFYEPCYNMYVTRKLIGNWKRYTCFHERYSNSFYGYCGTVYRFMPARNLSFEPNLQYAPQTAKCLIDLYNPVKYKKIRLFWGKAKTPWSLKVYQKDSLVFEEHFEASDDFHVTEIELKNSPKKLMMEFQAIESPDLYGFSLDNDNGLFVDNLALRGHSGNGFHILNTSFLKFQYEALNHKLIMFQFGGNIIPYTNVKNFKWYEDDLYKMLLKFKKAAPNASILVISNMDMGFKGVNGIQSYPTAPKVRDAQKRAALKAGVAFVDIFELMGGTGAIIDWYQKGFALNDYAHLTPKGQKKIAEFIVNALLKDYELYKKHSPVSNLNKLLN